MLDGQKILLHNAQIEQYNRQNRQRPETNLVDLTGETMVLSGVDLQSMLYTETVPDETRFDPMGNAYTAEMYEVFTKRIPTICEEATIEVKCGVMTDNCNLRCFPTMAGNYREKDGDELDRFAKTLLKFGEPVLVYCADTSGAWYFVRSSQMDGWVQSAAVALAADEAYWLQYVQERNFVQVIASRDEIVYIDFCGYIQQQLLLMGTRLVLHDASCCSFLVSLPQRGEQGQLQMLQTLIPRTGNYYIGWLPLTRQNILSQAKKMLGEPYGWGGANTWRDCTSLVDDSYSVFGFQLPRNSTQQRKMEGIMAFDPTYTEPFRKAMLNNLPVGTVLYLPGHAMIYLGHCREEYRILHSAYQIGLPAADHLITHKVCRVMEGHLDQLRYNGKTFLESLTEFWDVGQLGK